MQGIKIIKTLKFKKTSKKKRDIEILQKRIAELNIKIPHFQQNNISEIKRNKLIAKRERYQQELYDLLAS